MDTTGEEIERAFGRIEEPKTKKGMKPNKSLQ
jgi:hypothetical protein